jgi:hypothetical protein
MKNSHTLKGSLDAHYDENVSDNLFYPDALFIDENGKEVLGIEDIEIQANIEGTKLILTIENPSFDIKIGKYHLKTMEDEDLNRCSLIHVEREDCPGINFAEGVIALNIKDGVLEIHAKY